MVVLAVGIVEADAAVLVEADCERVGVRLLLPDSVGEGKEDNDTLAVGSKEGVLLRLMLPEGALLVEGDLLAEGEGGGGIGVGVAARVPETELVREAGTEFEHLHAFWLPVALVTALQSQHWGKFPATLEHADGLYVYCVHPAVAAQRP